MSPRRIEGAIARAVARAVARTVARTMVRPVAVGLIGLGSVCAPLGAQAQDADLVPFPHEEHEGLFPLCTGCHAGAERAGVGLYPSQDLCQQCHDGVREEPVPWSGPSPRATHVRFQHIEHVRQVADTPSTGFAGDSALSCESCHAPAPGTRWEVTASTSETCWSCHAHERPQHFAAGGCLTCHAPLSQSSLGASDLASWSPPEDHEAPGFLERMHGELAVTSDGMEGCATCHTRERCTSCHVDGSLEPIQALGFAHSGLRLPTYGVAYPTPATHELSNWLEDHNTLASRAECATCHTQQDCRSCHVTPVPVVVGQLPTRAQSLAPGVQLVRIAPQSHRRASYTETHGIDAAADDRLCTTCHTPVTCITCHQTPERTTEISATVAPPSRITTDASAAAVPSETSASLRHLDPPPDAGGQGGGFHPAQYDLRHAADAWGATLECSNCHDSVVFCRACHVESGLGRSGTVGQGYHDAAGPWLLRHGQAARQSLETCASCHRQRECMQCHSTTGGFRVNPHGEDFDADLMREKAGRTCFACHSSVPGGGGG